MLIFGFAAIFIAFVVPAICVYAMNREDYNPTIQALAILVLAPFVAFLVRVLRLNL